MMMGKVDIDSYTSKLANIGASIPDKLLKKVYDYRYDTLSALDTLPSIITLNKNKPVVVKKMIYTESLDDDCRSSIY